MAYLKRFKVNNTIYDLADAGSRSALMKLLGLTTDAQLDAWAASADGKALADAAWLGVTTSIRGIDDASDELLPSEKAVRGALAGLVNGTHFVGKTDPNAGATPEARLAALDPSPTAGDIAIDGVTEYIYDGSDWQQLGDESLWVPYTRTIAGVDLQDDITETELATALELGAFAYTSTVSANVAGETIRGLTIGYQPAGSVSLDGFSSETTSITSTGDYTPEGSITGTASLLTGGSITVTTKDASVASNAVLTTSEVTYANDISTASTNVLSAVGIKEGTTDDYQITGEVSAPTVTLSAPTASFVTGITSVAPSFTSSFTAATFTQSDYQAAESGVNAEIDSQDSEMLVFTTATTHSVSAISSWNAGSFTSTFDAGSVYVNDTADAVTGVSVSSVSAPVFIGGYITTVPTSVSVLNSATAVTSTFDNVTSATYVKSVIDTAEFTPENNASLGFSGTSAAISVSGDYDKVTTGTASFVGTAATLNVPDVVISAQTITVSAPAHSFS